jgi:hypothetical protein
MERVQHALVPNGAVRPLLDGWRLFGGGSPEGHCGRSLVRSFGLHASISLRPFAPPALTGFVATMNALTPVHGPFLEVATAVSYLPRRPTLRLGLDGCDVVRPQPLCASRRVRLWWTGIPVSFVASSVHSASNHPLPSRCVIWCFLPSGLPPVASLPMRRVLADQASWASPLASVCR